MQNPFPPHLTGQEKDRPHDRRLVLVPLPEMDAPRQVGHRLLRHHTHSHHQEHRLLHLRLQQICLEG